jgi:hypothetical protein
MFIARNTPNLVGLHINGLEPEFVDGDDDSVGDLKLVVPIYPPIPHLCKFWYIGLCRLGLAQVTRELLSHLHIPQLSRIKLDVCQHIEASLNTLSSSLTPSTTALTRCDVSLPWDIRRPRMNCTSYGTLPLVQPRHGASTHRRQYMCSARIQVLCRKMLIC